MQGLRELFLSECEVSWKLGHTIAGVHGKSLELLSFVRVKFMPEACEDVSCISRNARNELWIDSPCFLHRQPARDLVPHVERKPSHPYCRERREKT